MCAEGVRAPGDRIAPTCRYHRNVREENGADPNRDFPYANSRPTLCMQVGGSSLFHPWSELLYPPRLTATRVVPLPFAADLDGPCHQRALPGPPHSGTHPARLLLFPPIILHQTGITGLPLPTGLVTKALHFTSPPSHLPPHPQTGITFHGGLHSITYEWGSPNHQAHGSEAPDDRSQAAMTEARPAEAPLPVPSPPAL